MSLAEGSWFSNRKMTLLAAIFFSICLMLLSQEKCIPFPELGFDGPSMSSFTGDYANPNYLFSVTIPKGLVGHDAPPPAPQHGFGVVLSWEAHSYFWFDSSPNSALWDNEKEALKDNLGLLRSSAQEIVSVHECRALLGHQAARKQIVCYVCKEDPAEKRMQVIILSLKRGFVDEAGLVTTSDRFTSDCKTFMAAVATWRATDHSGKQE